MQLRFDFAPPSPEKNAAHSRAAGANDKTPGVGDDAPRARELRASEPSARLVRSEDLEKRRRQLLTELRLYTGVAVAVVLHTNRQSMVSARKTRLGYHFRLHRIFAYAPPDVVMALGRLIEGGDRSANLVIDDYIEQHSEMICELARPSPVQTRGEVFDLQAIFETLNATFFDGQVNVRVTWGRASAGRRRSIKLGSYHASERLIRIHPALDQRFVPQEFLAFVLFHEMLHERIGTRRSHAGRRCVHPPEFRALEARFPHAAAALQWERDNLHRLLKYRIGAK